jgi:hypothetical protein
MILHLGIWMCNPTHLPGKLSQSAESLRYFAGTERDFSSLSNGLVIGFDKNYNVDARPITQEWSVLHGQGCLSASPV